MAKTKSPKPKTASQQELDYAPLADDLTPAELHAVKRVAKQADGARDQLRVGLHHIDLAVRLRGTVSVGDDQPGGTTTETPKAEAMLGVLLAFLSKATRERALEALAERYAGWLAGAGEPELDADERARASEAFQRLSRQAARAGKRGNVSGAIECRLIRRYEL